MLDVEAHIIAAVHFGRWPIFLVMLYPRRNAASGLRAKGRARILQFPREIRQIDDVRLRRHMARLRLRDCGINAFVIVGVATEIGIEPTARHGADLGYIPVLIPDACGVGNEEAAERSIEGLKFAGDALITDTETICDLLRKGSGVRKG